MKIALETLGCKLNQAESETLARQLAEAGHRLVPGVDEADVYILNTCTVTHLADAKCRHLLRLAHRRNPGALLLATGCYAERVPQELAQIEGVSLVVGNDKKPQLLTLLEESGYVNRAPPVSEPGAMVEPAARRTRAFIKVQDGCNNLCAYCIVPLVRGGERSLPAAQIVAEVRRRIADGYKEVVLTGTEIGAYGYDGVDLKGLLERILAETNIDRLRLSSLQPQEISAGLLELWRDRRLCPHFHLSLQSGSDGVLRRMRRHYSAGDYQRSVSLIRSFVPDAAITTDVIVGFPGESEAEFEESYRFCKEIDFARIHVFPYSARPGTEAAVMPLVAEAIKKERSQRMLALAGESVRNFKQRFLGKVRPVLWESECQDGLWSGLTDNYIKVYTRSCADLANKLQPVRVA